MGDSKQTEIQMPPLIRYLSQSSLQNLQLTIQDIVASIEHLIHRFLRVKTLVLNPDNPKHGLPSINALVTLLDSRTGLPLAVLDGNWVTAVRTAGLSGVAAKRLARSDASVAAFIGCGVQAHSHLQALAALFPLKQIRAFGRGAASRDVFCRRAEKMGVLTIASQTPQEAICDADLIVTSVTLSPQLVPFLDVRWLKPGAFVTMTDLAAPWLAESTPAFDRIIVDDLEQEASMPKPLVDQTLVFGDLTGLVNGDVAGRCTDNERTAFVFRGLALWGIWLSLDWLISVLVNARKVH